MHAIFELIAGVVEDPQEEEVCSCRNQVQVRRAVQDWEEQVVLHEAALLIVICLFFDKNCCLILTRLAENLTLFFSTAYLLTAFFYITE